MIAARTRRGLTVVFGLVAVAAISACDTSSSMPGQTFCYYQRLATNHLEGTISFADSSGTIAEGPIVIDSINSGANTQPAHLRATFNVSSADSGATFTMRLQTIPGDAGASAAAAALEVPVPTSAGTYAFANIGACLRLCPNGFASQYVNTCAPDADGGTNQACTPVDGSVVVHVNSRVTGPVGWGLDGNYGPLSSDHVEIDLSIPQSSSSLSTQLTARYETAVDKRTKSGVGCD